MDFSIYTKEFLYNWKLASPVILGMLGHILVSFVDNIMVGQLGTAELAAVSLGNSFVLIAMSIGIGFSLAITPIVAEADSSANFLRVSSIFKHGLLLCSLISAALFVLVFFSKSLLNSTFLGQPEEVVNLAIPYLELVALSLVPLIIFQSIKQFSDGLSMTKYPMYAGILANLVNVLLNYVLIFGKFGFPVMGIIGAAYGTLFSRLLMVICLWGLLSKKASSKRFITNMRGLPLNLSMAKKIITLGAPSALQMFFEIAIFTAAIWLSGLLGKNTQAANQIALNLSSITFMVASGIGVAAMIRAGNQRGLHNYRGLRRIAISNFLLSAILALGVAVIFLLFRFQLPKIYVDINESAHYSDNIEVLGIASKLLLVAAIFQISDSIQVVVLGALRGLQDTTIPTLITFISYWMIGFPISYFLGKEEFYGIFGIWLGLLAGLISASFLLYQRFNYLTLKLLRTKRHGAP